MLQPRIIAQPCRALRVKLARPALREGHRTHAARRSILTGRLGQDNSVLIGLIGANVGVYGLWSVADNDRRLRHWMACNFTVTPADVLGRPHTLVTGMFSHRDGWHLLGNMVTLFFFAPEAISVLGARAFLQLYFGAGVFSSCCQCVTAHPYSSALGASGAINAIVTWGVLRNPSAIIITPIEVSVRELHAMHMPPGGGGADVLPFPQFIPIPMPALLFGAMYVGKDALGLFRGDSSIGHGSHLGGALCGILFFTLTRGRGRY